MLLDTSGLFSFFDSRDALHSNAVTLFRSARRRVTHSYVLAELVALCHARKLDRIASLTFVDELASNPHVEVHWIDEDGHRAALGMLRAQPDKTYSLCDAVSFMIMRDTGLTGALSTDRHFEQAGFTRLLK